VTDVLEKLLTSRVVNRRAHGSGSGDPVIVDGLVGSDNDTVALSSVYVNVIAGQRLVAVPVYFDDLPVPGSMTIGYGQARPRLDLR